jgi:fimbrial chaperone protein
MPRLLRFWWMLCACLGLVLCQVGGAWAAVFEVSPVRMPLSAAAPSGLLTVRNQSSEPMRFQVTAFAWSQSPSGGMVLAPTQDIVVFPTLLALKPGESRNLRVGATTSFGAVEKSYRVFVEELPPLASQRSTNQVRVLTRMGIPVFLAAPAPAATPRVDGLAVNGQTLSFALRNAGNTHFLARKVRVAALDAGGRPLFEHELPSWYVLGGGVRDYTLDLPPDACKAARLKITVETEQGAVDAMHSPPGKLCRP